jgi:hypothetical protein
VIDTRWGTTGRRVGLLRRAWPLVAVAAVLVTTGPGIAGADDTRPAFVNGDAKASANLFDFKVQITGAIGSDSGLGIGFGAGRALTQYQDSTATAEGRALDYALTDLLNMQPTAECPDVIPIFLNSTKPPVTLADSSDPSGAGSHLTPVKYAGFPTYGPDFGTQDATAGPGVTSHATTTAFRVASGVVDMVNPKSESTTRVANGVREAVATSSADSLSILGGAMILQKPVWTATARSGATTVNSATFTYSSAQILGMTRPGGRNDDLNAFKGFVEGMFSGLGLKMFLPTATVEPGPNGTGSVSISPLRLGFQDIPLASSLLAPLLHAISPQIDQALAAYLAQKCSNPAMQLIADVARGIASGHGGLSFSVGGADAMTDDVYYPPVSFDTGSGSLGGPPTAPSFDTGASVLGTDLSAGSSLGSSLDSSSLTTDTVPLDDTTTTAAPSEGPEESAGPQVAPLQRAADRSKPGSSGGTAGWVTLAALAAVVALGAADQLVMRRSRRKFA